MILNTKTIMVFLTSLLFFQNLNAEALNALRAEETSSDNDKSVTANPHIRSGHARALLAIEKEKMNDDSDKVKTLVITTKVLKDNKGQQYVAGLINSADVEQYLSLLKKELGENYHEFRQHQRARDHGLFHVTLVTPNEYQVLSHKSILEAQQLRIQLHGLGKVEKENAAAYFVVVSSADSHFFRQKLLLKKKDFHITLAFKPHDIHGVSKNIETLINQQ